MNTATATEQQTDELSTILANIRGNSGAEIKYAECLSRALYNRGLDELDLSRARNIWHSVRAERKRRDWQTKTADGYCMTCERPSSLRQCMDCREGRREGYRPRYQSIV